MKHRSLISHKLDDKGKRVRAKASRKMFGSDKKTK